MNSLRVVAILLTAVLASPSNAAAQDPPPTDPMESMPVRVGPFGLTPSLTVADIGVDDNVFNSDTDPQRDFTATIVPRIVARLRARRMLVTYRTSSDFVYYQEFSSQRSINNSSDLRFDFALGRLQPFVTGGLQGTRARLNAEVDVRAHRAMRSASAGTRVLVGSRTALSVAVRHAETEFDPGILFQGAELAKTLNSRQQAFDGGVHFVLTPLTTLELGGSLQHDRFAGDPTRDADMIRVGPVLHFSPDALLRGTAAIGFRSFRPLSNTLPDYSGLYLATTLSYTLLERTKFDWQLSRDVHYSFEEISPYYLNTANHLTITQQLVGRFDVQATGGRQRLEYRSAVGADASRVDFVDVIGGGVGIRLRENVRVGLNAEYARRVSDRELRQYERRRIFASLSYGS